MRLYLSLRVFTCLWDLLFASVNITTLLYVSEPKDVRKMWNRTNKTTEDSKDRLISVNGIIWYPVQVRHVCDCCCVVKKYVNLGLRSHTPYSASQTWDHVLRVFKFWSVVPGITSIVTDESGHNGTEEWWHTERSVRQRDSRQELQTTHWLERTR